MKVRSVAFAPHARVRMFEHITQHKSKSKFGTRPSRAEADADSDTDTDTDSGTLSPGSVAAVAAAATLSGMHTEIEALPAEGGNFSLFRARTPTVPSTFTSTPAPAHAPAVDISASDTPVSSASSCLTGSIPNLGVGSSGGESDQRREHENATHAPAHRLSPSYQRNPLRIPDTLSPLDLSLDLLELDTGANGGEVDPFADSDLGDDDESYYLEHGSRLMLDMEQARTRAPVAGQRDFPGVSAAEDEMNPRIEGDDGGDGDANYAEIVRRLKLAFEQAGIRAPVAGQLDFTDVPALDDTTSSDPSDSSSVHPSELDAPTAPARTSVHADPAIATGSVSADFAGSVSAEPEPVARALRVTHRNTTPARYPATDKDADGNKENTLHAVTPSPPTIPIRTGRSKKRERAGAERAAPRRSGRLQVVREMR